VTAIEARDVTFAYGDRPVVEGVTLAVAEGAFLGLVGPNGSGKTTLLELLIGLRRPDGGSATLFGEPAHRFDDGERIGYVPQNVTTANDGLPITVEEVVRIGRYPHRWVGRFDADDRRAVRTALDRVGIADLADRRVGRLSVVSASAPSSPGRWRRRPTCSCSTSRPSASTPSPERRSTTAYTT